MIGIYVITNISNGKKYIGQSVDVEDRLAHHKSSLKHNRHENSYLQNSWNKYGEDCFTFEILEQCSEDELDEQEKYYIKKFQTTNRMYGYNREDGGSLNKHMSEESKMKMSRSKQGVYDGEKNPMYGVHLVLSEERKKRLSYLMSGNRNPMYGKKVDQTPERRALASERMKGDKNPFYGCKHTELTKQKMRKNNKAKKSVRCIETGNIYESTCEAGRQTGICCSSIAKCCNNKRRTAGNLHWEYAA